jgi:hypothetical protein
MDFLKKVIGFIIGFAIVSLAIYLIRGGDKLKKFEPYHSVQGRFSILFPGEPRRDLRILNTAYGSLNLITLRAGSKNTGFAAAYCDYPREMVQDADVGEMLDGARDGAVSNVNGELVYETVINFHGRPGRELEIEMPGQATIRARIILIDNRLYQIMGISKSVRILDRKCPEFFDSFTVDGIN